MDVGGETADVTDHDLFLRTFPQPSAVLAFKMGSGARSAKEAGERNRLSASGRVHPARAAPTTNSVFSRVIPTRARGPSDGIALGRANPSAARDRDYPGRESRHSERSEESRSSRSRGLLVGTSCHLGPASRTAGSFCMSGMRDMLGIALYRDAPAPNEPN